MKTKKTKPGAATPSPKGRVKIKNLKLTKETIEKLSDEDASTVRGGNTGMCSSNGTYSVIKANHNETFVCDLKNPS